MRAAQLLLGLQKGLQKGLGKEWGLLSDRRTVLRFESWIVYFSFAPLLAKFTAMMIDVYLTHVGH